MENKAIKICEYNNRVTYKLNEWTIEVYQYRSGNRYDGWRLVTMHTYWKPETNPKTENGGIRRFEEKFKSGKIK